VSQKKKWKGRAPDATADEMFERALVGDDPSSRKSFDPREDRKTQQLGQQVKRALMLALAGECDDDVLRDVYVDSVEPMGSGAQLLVRVTFPSVTDQPLWDVVARLNDRSAKLRAIVAHSICRKRAPALAFVAVPQTPESFHGGMP
jgi:ribosome-binding factor A